MLEKGGLEKRHPRVPGRVFFSGRKKIQAGIDEMSERCAWLVDNGGEGIKSVGYAIWWSGSGRIDGNVSPSQR